jgi:hypothetical protein
MKMVDIKLPKKTKKEMMDEMPAISTIEERDRWPYGLRLHFETEQIDKLPHLKDMKIGQKVTVQGVGEVTEISMREQKEGKESWVVEVQLHEVGCESNKHESMLDAMTQSKKARTL